MLQQLCPRCNSEFDPGPWRRRYCSRSCANSRNFTAEARLKKSQALKGRARSDDYDIEGWRSRVQQRWRTKARNRPWEELSAKQKLDLICEEQAGACAHCGITEWLNYPVVLKLVNLDRNPGNPDRSNLQAVCANCRQQHLRQS